MSLLDAFYTVLPPLHFSFDELERISKNIQSLEQEGNISVTEIEKKRDFVEYRIKLNWLKNVLEEPIYDLTDSAEEIAPSTVYFNKKVAEHCQEQPFHLNISYVGLISIMWKIPKKWSSVPDKIDKVMNRFVTIVVSRAFESSTIERDLFHNPYYFTQGFAFGKVSDALQKGIERTCTKYVEFISLFLKLSNWKLIILFREQVKLIRERFLRVASIIDMNEATLNSSLNRFSDLQRSIELNMFDCIVKDVLLWEMSDSF